MQMDAMDAIDSFLKRHKNEKTVDLLKYIISHSVMSKTRAKTFIEETNSKKLMEIVLQLKVNPIVYTDDFFKKYFTHEK